VTFVKPVFAREAGTYIYLVQRDGRLSWPGW